MKKCRFCAAPDVLDLYTTKDLWANSYHICRCQRCGAFFLHPPPSPEALERAYDDSYYGTQDTKFKGPVERVIDKFRKLRAKRYGKLINDGDRVLDIGCGNGNFLMFLLKYGNYNVYGSELAGKSALRAAAHKKINLKTGKLNLKDYTPRSYALITMFHVFEHLEEPVQMLEDIDKLLKENGSLVISFPNIDSFQSRFFKGRWLHLDPPRHLLFFKPKDFKALMQKRGYEIVSEKYFCPEQNPFGLVQSILNMFCKKRELLFEHLKGNKPYTTSYPPAKLFFQKVFFVVMMPAAVLCDAFAALFRKSATVTFVFKKKTLPK